MLAAHGADHIFMLGDERIHLIKAHGVHVHLGMLLADELVGAMTGLAALAVQQGIGEAGHMAGGHPGLGVHDDGGIQAHVGGAFLHEFLHPGPLHVVLELHAQRAVVPAVGQAAVDLAARVYKAAVLAQVDDGFKGLFAVFHILLLTARLAAAPHFKRPPGRGFSRCPAAARMVFIISASAPGVKVRGASFLAFVLKSQQFFWCMKWYVCPSAVRFIRCFPSSACRCLPYIEEIEVPHKARAQSKLRK